MLTVHCYFLPISPLLCPLAQKSCSYSHITSQNSSQDVYLRPVVLCARLRALSTKCSQRLSLLTDVSPHIICFLFLAVMDISDLIKGKIECDEEKQFFIPFFPYVLYFSSSTPPLLKKLLYTDPHCN